MSCQMGNNMQLLTETPTSLEKIPLNILNLLSCVSASTPEAPLHMGTFIVDVYTDVKNVLRQICFDNSIQTEIAQGIKDVSKTLDDNAINTTFMMIQGMLTSLTIDEITPELVTELADGYASSMPMMGRILG